MISIFKALLIGSRPKTLTASIAPVILGFSLSYISLKTLPDVSVAIPLLVTAILIQILTNYVNDLFDFRKGKDTVKRIGPVRVLQSGLISDRAMTNSIYALTAIIFLLGWYLVLHGGVPILIIGLLSVLGAYCYTAGPYPLAYNGLGEVFVFIFFGPVAVCGTEYMLTGTFTDLGLMFGSILGGIASALLIVNNTRDIEEDRGTGKRTLVSLYGRNFANFLFGTSLLLPIFVTALLQAESFPLVSFLAVTYLFFLRLLKKFRKLKEGPEFNLMLGTIGKVLFIFSILASIVITLFLG